LKSKERLDEKRKHAFQYSRSDGTVPSVSQLELEIEAKRSSLMVDKFNGDREPILKEKKLLVALILSQVGHGE
jgi:hypothetical protein